MKLIVGLGNPGKTYQGTRHNIGAAAVRAVAVKHDGVFKRGLLSSSLTVRIKIGTEAVLLALPLTYMNLSGQAVAALVRKYKIDTAGLLIVLDDLDLELGRLRLKASGSAGGHKGLASVIQALDTQQVARLRIGIGRPPDAQIDPAAYVLSTFSRREKPEAEETVEKAAEAIELWITESVEKTMNSVNR